MAATEIEPHHGARHPRGWWLVASMSIVGAVGFGWADVAATAGVELSATAVNAVDALLYTSLACWGSVLVRRATAAMSRRGRMAWTLLACGVLAWALAALIDAWSALTGIRTDESAVVSVVVLGANILLVVAVWSIPPSRWRPERARRVDTAIMVAAALCLMWAFRLERTVESTDGVARFVDLQFDVATSYTLLNFLAILVAVTALTRCRPDRRGEIAPIAAALVAASLGDLASYAASLSGDGLGRRAGDAMYLLALALFVVVGRRLVGPERSDAGVQATNSLLALPELATLVALGALAIRQRVDQGSTVATVALGTLMVLLATVRLGQLEHEQRTLSQSLRNSARQLRSDARTDLLTGLGNRLALDERLGLAVERLRRSSGTGELTVFFIDLDHFKRVNDGLGHQVGDELLLEVARRLRTVMGEDVFRVGGDEFVSFREHVDPRTIETMASAALEAFAEPVVASGHELTIAVSIGLTTRSADQTPRDAPELDSDVAAQLLRQADLALYRAKELGRGRLARYDSDLRRRADQRRALQQALRCGIRAGEMEVHFRPVMDLTDGSVAGAQASLRWRSAAHGLLNPRSFIDAAADSGLLPDLDSIVFDEIAAALRTSAALARAEDERSSIPMWVSTRLSRPELTHPALIDLVSGVLSRTGCEPAHLRVEVSEDTIIDPAALDAVVSLRALGVHLTVAAFGTGPSSLIRLSSYPASTIKLDRSFVEGLGRRRDDTLVVSIVAELTGDLGLELAADGIGEDFQVELLRDLGCRYGQGRYVGPAVSRAEFFGVYQTEDGPAATAAS